MKAIYVFALMFIWIQIVSGSDEKGVAKIAKERNEDAPSGDSDHELPSHKLKCFHRMYDWGGNKTMRVICDSKKHRCAYVYISYYNSEDKLIHLLSQHCNHKLGPTKRQNHCDAMNKVIKDAGSTPYTKCEMKECDKDLCNKPFEGGMRPAWIVLISLASAAGVFLCLLCTCCCLRCFTRSSDSNPDGKPDKNKNQSPTKNEKSAPQAKINHNFILEKNPEPDSKKRSGTKSANRNENQSPTKNEKPAPQAKINHNVMLEKNPEADSEKKSSTKSANENENQSTAKNKKPATQAKNNHNVMLEKNPELDSKKRSSTKGAARTQHSVKNITNNNNHAETNCDDLKNAINAINENNNNNNDNNNNDAVVEINGIEVEPLMNFADTGDKDVPKDDNEEDEKGDDYASDISDVSASSDAELI